MVRALIDRIRQTKDTHLLLSVVPQFQARSYKKGETLLHQGAVWDKAFFIERGLIRLHTIGLDGKDFSTGFWAEGGMVFPITADMEQQAAGFNISALEDSTVWQASMSDLRPGLENRGLWEPLRAELLGTLLGRKSQRELDLQTLDGRARYQKFCQQEPSLAARVPLVHLASYLGITDVSLSRIRRQLKDAQD
ncbi:MAG: Crp/Fnr family transcriptional regulator [Pseudomonadota bacterium]